MSQKQAHSVDARTAELLARQINTGFMNACGYGMDHPLTNRACESIHHTLTGALEKDPMLSLILDRGSLFVEKHPVANRFNPRRMIDSFNELNLESITFDAGVKESDISALISVLSQLLDYDSLTAAEQDLKRHQSGAIRFNYIVYRKVTSDQKVVGGEVPGDDPGQPLSTPRASGPATAAGERVLDQLDSFFSLGQMAGDPNGAADQLAASSDGDNAKRVKLVAHLKNLVREVEMGRGNVEGLSPEELFSAMNSLRQRVHKSVSLQEDVDRIMSEGGEVISEIDELTYSTLVNLVREEYRGGQFSVKRMAQIINRMLPDARDLKRLLPRLRTGLMQEGMAVDQYNELVHELSSELRGEHLVGALEAGAENVGMDVDEIVRQIQDDPTEAARLVVLAGELRQGGVSDDNQLSSAFTDYIERVSQKLALSSFSGDASLDTGTLGHQIERVQKDLLARMNASGLAPETSKQLEQELEQRMPQLRDDSKMALFDRMLGGSEQVTDTLILDWLEKQVESTDELETLTAAISERLKQHGFSAQDAARLIDELAERLARDDAPPKLPPSVLSVSNTALFLKHEVKSAQRYGNPFSGIKVLVEWLVAAQGGAQRRPRTEDMREMLPEIYFRIVRLARDLDLVGSLEKSQRAVPFLILPMTDEAGANVFRGRLLDVLREFPIRIESGEYYLTCTVTAVGFDTEVDSDANAFIQRLNKLHQANRAETTRQAAQGGARPQSGGRH